MRLKLDKFPLIGMIHLPNLAQLNNLEKISQYAVGEAGLLEELGYSAVLIENFFDNPFPKVKIPEDILLKYTLIVDAVKKVTKIPIGVNLLRNACMQALNVATVLDLPFIRCNIWEAAYVTDQGIIEGAAYDVITKKKALSSNTLIFADIHVKHAKPLGNFTLLESAENAIERGKADQIIVSGISTGISPDINQLEVLSSHGYKPIIGSGMSIKSLDSLKDHISGSIIGTSIKRDSDIKNGIDKLKAMEFITEWNKTFDSFS